MKALVMPEYGGKSIVEVPHFIMEFFGASRHPLMEHHTDSLTFQELNINKDKEHLVLIIIDGLGYQLFKKLKEEHAIPFLSSLHSAYITSTFPSTTATALVSFASGLLPSEHGILGFRMFLDRPFTTMNTIFYNIEGLENTRVPLDEKVFMPEFYIYESLAREGVRVYPFLRKEFIGSSFSKIVYGFMENVPHSDDIDLVVGASKVLDKEGGRRFISLYTPTVDTLSHAYGPYSEEVLAFMRFFDELLDRYLSKYMDNTLFLITADHGHIPTTEEKSIDICKKSGIYKRIIGYPAGEPRAMYLNVRDKKEFVKEVENEFGDVVHVMLRSEVEHKGLWGGKLKEEFRQRVGDVVLIPKENYYIVCGDNDKNTSFMKGRHGGLSLEEMLVPLIYN